MVRRVLAAIECRVHARPQVIHRPGRGTCPRSSGLESTRTSRKEKSGDKSLFPTCDFFRFGGLPGFVVRQIGRMNLWADRKGDVKPARMRSGSMAGFSLRSKCRHRPALRRCSVALSLMLLAAPLVALAGPIMQEQARPAQAAAPASATPRVGVDESRPLVLTLFDAVKMALEHNPEIEVERINVKQAQYDLFAAHGSRDVLLSSNSYYEHKVVPIGSVLAGGPNGALTTESVNYDFGAQQLLSTGGQWAAQFSNTRLNSNSQFSSINPQYNTSINIQLRQPLMRNLSIDDARRKIRIAGRRLDQSDAEFRRKAIDIVSRVQQAYWNLLFAIKDLQIRREAVYLAKTQFERNQRMVKDGMIAAIDLVSVEVEIERRNESALTAVDALTRAENSLKQLILGDREAPVWGQAIVPAESLEVRAVALTLPEAIAAAFAKRPELASSSLDQEMNKVDVKYLDNQTRPQLDLIASYTTTGLSGSLVNNGVSPFTATTNLLLDRVNLLSSLSGLPPVVPPPASQVPGFLIGGYGQSLHNLLANDFRTFRFGVSLSFPLRNRIAQSQLGRAVAEGQKITARRKILEQTVEAEVRNALQSVEGTRQRVEAAKASREAAQKQLESEQRRFAAGLSTTYFVLERQNNLSEAQGRELRAVTEYNKAVSELQRVMGVTLTSANVDVASPRGR